MPIKMSRLKHSRASLIFLAAVALLVLIGLFTTVNRWPSFEAQGADVLRSILGNQPVADLEMILFRTQDTLQRWEFALGLKKPEAPWEITTAQIPPAKTPDPEIGSTRTPATTSPSQVPITSNTAAPSSEPDTRPPSPLLAQVTPTPIPWEPAPASPSGNLEGEGVWSKYIQDSTGNTVAYRTFIQPDPSRPYTVVAVIAFDLNLTRLHYVLGSVEPYSPDSPKRSGTIDPKDLMPGVLLATFNGGFKATHGQFGAMAGGITALPGREGLGTLVIGNDGKVSMGEWGVDIYPAGDVQAWRQNGPLVIHNGQINPKIYDNSPKDWGYTVNDVSPTWRSGIGINADGSTLYYFVGPKMTMEALAKIMLAVGAVQGMQLDINNYWVHFAAIYWEDRIPLAVPLFPDSMGENVDRYLHPYTRDFFYLTTSLIP
jgi:hypothetical protein